MVLASDGVTGLSGHLVGAGSVSQVFRYDGHGAFLGADVGGDLDGDGAEFVGERDVAPGYLGVDGIDRVVRLHGGK